VFAVPEAGERCPVGILDKYMKMYPTRAFLRMSSRVKKIGAAVPLTLQNMVKRMCLSAG